MNTRWDKVHLGKALESAAEESTLMARIFDLLHKRNELERQHLAELQRLNSSFGQIDDGGPLSTFALAIFSYLDQDLSARSEGLLKVEQKIEEAMAIKESMDSPSGPVKGLQEMKSILTELSGKEKSHEETLTIARETLPIKNKDKSVGGYLKLPQEDLNYRRAVHMVNQCIPRCAEFYDEKYSEILETHQSAMEVFKGMIISIALETSTTGASTVRFSSQILQTAQDFSASRATSHEYEWFSNERASVPTQVPYLNFLNGGAPSNVVLGLALQGDSKEFLQAVIKAYPYSKSIVIQGFLREFLSWRVLYELEENWNTQKAEGLIKKVDSGGMHRLMEAILWNLPEPVLKFSPKVIKQFSNGVPRKQIATLIEGLPSDTRALLLDLLKICRPEYWHEGLTHGAVGYHSIIWAIEKWDFETGALKLK